ncbi:NRDE family protein [Sphaerisporangium sp. TRM90804]|uniref:NRDE family protein n=1 Tax=Sphaerisporangium sp. TRM90804 TaxID=3031113 RepID=UPI0024481B08|nr:NRDE family protein [Sphaerisporangium sp. TRM90804]MDH2430168.1 NRDE family protein [Sphaerisporangium sp. TRM90804]
MIVAFEAGAETPVVLAGVRDEFAARPWQPPAAHWPGLPGVVGGRDAQAGGTWLAADPGLPRVAALLNGIGPEAPAPIRRSRGDLPLRAVRAGGLPEGSLECYDPFHLLVAEPGGVRLWSWDGRRVTENKLPDGVHVVVNSGWEPGDGDPRAARFRPRFAAAPRPSAHVAGDDGAWRAWRALAGGDGLPVTHPEALVALRELEDGRVWGTSSITLVALGAGAMRHDFCPRPQDQASWYTVPRPPAR